MPGLCPLSVHTEALGSIQGLDSGPNAAANCQRNLRELRQTSPSRMATVRAGGPMNIACEPGERKSHEKRVHPFLKAFD